MQDSQNHLKEFLVALSRANVEFVVCGGVASILHGVPRITFDLDISVKWSGDNLRRLINCMESLSLKPKVPIPPESLIEPQVVKMMIEEKGALCIYLSGLR